MPDFNLGTARGRIDIDSSGLRQVGTQADQTVSKLATLRERASGHLKAFGRNLTQLGRIMSVGVTLPVVAFGKIAIDEFTQFQQVQGQTRAALKSTGGEAGVSLKHIDDLSASMGKLSDQDAEVVQGAENILLTFPQVRNEAGKNRDIFDQASLAVQNLAARMGGDAQGAAIQVGKALSNPTKGITALTRVGVVFDDQQKKQIANFVKNNDLAGAQGVILKELNKEFGGSAAAMGKAASPMTKLSLMFQDFAQQVGPFFIKIAQDITNRIKGWIDWFNRLSPHMQQTILKILAIAAVIGPLIIVIGKLITAFGAAGKAIFALTKLFAANPWLLLIAAVIALAIIIIKNWGKIKAFLIKVWNAIKEAAATVWNAIKDAILQTVGFLLGWLVRGFRLYLTFMFGIFSKILHAAAAAFGWIPGIGGKLKNARDAFDTFKTHALDGLKKTEDGFFHLGDAVTGVTEKIVHLKHGIDEIRGPHDIIFHVKGLPPGMGRFRMGTMDAPGGLAMVGEAGPELTLIPRHSQVLTANQTRALLASLRGGSGSGVSHTYNVVINNPVQERAGDSMLRTLRKIAFLGLGAPS